MGKLPILVVAALLLLDGCVSDTIDRNEFRRWFYNTDNGLIKIRNVNNLTYTVQYRPIELMVLNEIKGIDISQSFLDSLKDTYGSAEYFMLQIGPSNQEGVMNEDLLKSDSRDYEAYAAKVKSLAFHMQDKVTLIIDSDTLQPSLFHFEQGFELSAKQRVLFAFQPTSDFNHGKMQFVLNDNLFGAGIMKFKFSINKSQLPSLPI